MYSYLTPTVVQLLRRLDSSTAQRLEEIRFRAGQAVEFVLAGKSIEQPLSLDTSQLQELLAALSGYALYACERQLAQGYLTVEGGHRAGVCGRIVVDGDGTTHMSGVSSVCLRIAHEIPGASQEIRRYLLTKEGRLRRVLLLGPPGCGKTTVLRDAALYLSDEEGVHVAVADEREELFARVGLAGGKRMDVLGGASKAQAFAMLLRSMAPQVIITDEIGRREDVEALCDASRCGVGLLTSAHADGLSDMLKRPVLRTLFEERVFERYILLGAHGCCRGIWDEEGRMLERVECRHDGNDRSQRPGLYSG